MRAGVAFPSGGMGRRRSRRWSRSWLCSMSTKMCRSRSKSAARSAESAPASRLSRGRTPLTRLARLWGHLYSPSMPSAPTACLACIMRRRFMFGRGASTPHPPVSMTHVSASIFAAVPTDFPPAPLPSQYLLLLLHLRPMHSHLHPPHLPLLILLLVLIVVFVQPLRSIHQATILLHPPLFQIHLSRFDGPREGDPVDP